MKPIIICTLLLLVTLNSFSQQTQSKPSYTQQDYLEKSKKQKTAGKILLWGGVGLMVTSFVIPNGELVYDGICVGVWCDDKYANDGIKSAVFIAGGLSALSSIPVFIISGKNRRNAASLSFKNEKTILLNNQSMVYTSVPALKMNVNF